ncbi:hypothetical protein Rhopal_007451-T1 [Rhodotorula paludigena]|uniref:MSP domain-containing protein n=1 Tax=Rhodotorula paludigena TaxID=86838 RepID=A0AAV5GZG5_9BASI|nr:hypothetical protein Rhopal_007451-T1 [Rhodotorula paludigena]
MSVTLQPSSQLGFQSESRPHSRPLTQLVKRTLSVSNHNHQAIAYKVKTTAPKQYCVRPNSGRIEPGETVEVQVLLQPMKEDPAPNTKCRDKFLVQSVVITPEREGVALPELWSTVEKEEKERTDGGQSQIFEQKIRCAYLPAADAEAASSIPEETSSAIDNSRAGPDSSFASTLNPAPQNPTAPNTATTSTPPPAADATAPPASSNPVLDSAKNAAAAAGGAAVGAAAAAGLPNLASAIEQKVPAGSSSSSTTPASASASGQNDELSRLRSELSSAKSEIDRLKKQLDASETTAATLRSRGAGAADRSAAGSSGVAGASQAVVELKGQDGVPIQVVVGIAFGVFVVTWLFF